MESRPTCGWLAFLLFFISTRGVIGAYPWLAYDHCLLCYSEGSDAMQLTAGCRPEGGDWVSCSGHGECGSEQEGCVCTFGYSGDVCQIPPEGLSSNLPAVGTVTSFTVLTDSEGPSSGTCLGNTPFDSGSFDLSFTRENLPDGVDGVAQVNPNLFGSRVYASTLLKSGDGDGDGDGDDFVTPYGFAAATPSAACNACYQLAATRDTAFGGPVTSSVVVVVIGRCDGTCKATSEGSSGECDTDGSSSRFCTDCLLPGTAGNGASSSCSCFTGSSVDPVVLQCAEGNGAECDWCLVNDHAHFQVDATSFEVLCGDNSIDGHCELDSIMHVPCDAFKTPWPNGQPTSYAYPPWPVDHPTTTAAAATTTPVTVATTLMAAQPTTAAIGEPSSAAPATAQPSGPKPGTQGTTSPASTLAALTTTEGPLNCTVPNVTAGVLEWVGNCSALSRVPNASSCSIVALSGFNCTSPGRCMDGVFEGDGTCWPTGPILNTERDWSKTRSLMVLAVGLPVAVSVFAAFLNSKWPPDVHLWKGSHFQHSVEYSRLHEAYREKLNHGNWY